MMQRAAAFRCEGGGGQDRRADELRQLLQAAGDVDRRADHGEIQAIARADVAELDLAPMQSYAEGERRAAFLRKRLVQRLGAGEGGDSRVQCAVAGCAARAL